MTPRLSSVGDVNRIIHTDTDNDLFVHAPDSAWMVKTDPLVPFSNLPSPYRQTNANGASVSMNFNGSIGVTLNGTRGCDHGKYFIVCHLIAFYTYMTATQNDD